jgi:hypothetical protein
MNNRVITLIQNWQTIGSPGQEGFNWTTNRHNWEKTFPNYTNLISKLPSEIDRVAVRDICESSNFPVLEKFLTVMVWGYGDRGYGPYRVNQMLNHENVEDILSKVFEFCKKGEPIEAYDYLRLNRIKILGPSYGSKFISFCTSREKGAPIYDSLIAKWITTFAKDDFLGISTSSENWNLRTYTKYWDWVKHHSEALDCYPDEVELVLFRDAESKFSKTSNWMGK